MHLSIEPTSTTISSGSSGATNNLSVDLSRRRVDDPTGPAPFDPPLPRTEAAASTPGRSSGWVVLKLGGSTMADAVARRRVLDRAVALRQGGLSVALVVSALRGVTDALIELWGEGRAVGEGLDDRCWRQIEQRHGQLLDGAARSSGAGVAQERFATLARESLRSARELWHRESNAERPDDVARTGFVALGERLAALGAAAELTALGHDTRVLDGCHFLRGHRDDDGVRPDLGETRRTVAQELGRGGQGDPELWVLPGFVVADQEGRPALLGRGGSDSSATLLGAALDALRVEIWTDVDGVFSDDPHSSREAVRFQTLSYRRAERLARAGARVLHEDCLAPASRAGVPIWVLSSRLRQPVGTWIVGEDVTPMAGASSPEQLVRRVEGLCRVPSPTGREEAVLPDLLGLVRALRPDHCWLQRIADGRRQLLVAWGEPRVLLCSHVDTVGEQGWAEAFQPHRVGDRLVARGAVDAKGQLIAQLEAIRRLLLSGSRGIAWAALVDEERNSLGARSLAEDPPDFLQRLDLVINGEPTGNELTRCQQGFANWRLRCEGPSLHAAAAERTAGRQATTGALGMMGRWLHALESEPLVHHRDFGEESWNLGVLRGGTESNVVAPSAEALIGVRHVPGSGFRRALERARPNAADGHSTAAECLHHTPPVCFSVWRDQPARSVAFGSDADLFSFQNGLYVGQFDLILWAVGRDE